MSSSKLYCNSVIVLLRYDPAVLSFVVLSIGRNKKASLIVCLLTMSAQPTGVGASDMDNMAVDCRLLHNEAEAEASRLFRSNKTNIRMGRLMTGVSCAVFASIAPLAFWQTSTVHRVWRIRHPKTVLQHQYIMGVNFMVGLGALLYLAGPFGYVEQSRQLLERMDKLDEAAWAAALLQHRIQTRVVDAATAQTEWTQLLAKRAELLS